jgi:16S rRNA C967 or C1407 C5-methylase (RsmB/RsmF family)
LTARDVARRVLDRVDKGGAWATLSLDGELSRSGLDERDRRLVSELVYGVLRNRARIDRALAAHARLKQTPPRVITALRIAAYQLLFLDRVPDYAAVDDAVNAARAAGGPKLAGFCNAVLRKLVTSGEPALPSDPRARLEIAHSLPTWIADELALALQGSGQHDDRARTGDDDRPHDASVVSPAADRSHDASAVSPAADRSHDASAVSPAADRPHASAVSPAADRSHDASAVSPAADRSHDASAVSPAADRSHDASAVSPTADRPHDSAVSPAADRSPDASAVSPGGDRLRELAAAFAEPAPIIARVNTLRATRDAVIEQLQAAGVTATPVAASPMAIALDGLGDPGRSASFKAGRWTVQDAGAQLVGLVAAPRAGQRILDACAGVGGKATHLAELSGDAARIDAADQSQTKLDLAREAARRLGITSLTGVACDLTDPAAPLAAAYDLIVLDAPCTGLGVLRRHPDAKWRIKPADVARLAAIQRQLLDAVVPRLAPGGALIYSVCTFTRAEGPDQIAALVNRTGLRLVAEHRTWPPEADAFYIARLERVDG